MNRTQDNFDSLHAVGGHHNGVEPLVDLCTISGGRRATKKTCVDDGVLAMLAAWEACEITRKKFEQAEESAILAMKSNRNCRREPLRSAPTYAPPKRFYITFWRSIARRMVARTRSSVESHVSGSDISG
jgi:hypothetical protein